VYANVIDMEKVEIKESKNPAVLRERAAGKIAHGILRVQNTWANWMHRQFDHAHPLKRRIWFGAFMLLIAASSIYSIAAVFLSPSTKGKSWMTSQAQMPSSGQVSIPPGNTNQYLTERVHAFEQYWDSLSQSESGRNYQKQILKAHPGMLDSLKQVKRIYKIK